MTWVKNVTGTWTYDCTMAHWMWVRRTRCWIEDAECSALALGKSPQNSVNQLTKLMRKLGFLMCYPIASGKSKCNAMQRITAVTPVQYAAQLSFICNAFYLLFFNEFFVVALFPSVWPNRRRESAWWWRRGIHSLFARVHKTRFKLYTRIADASIGGKSK